MYAVRQPDPAHDVALLLLESAAALALRISLWALSKII